MAQVGRPYELHGQAHHTVNVSCFNICCCFSLTALLRLSGPGRVFQPAETSYILHSLVSSHLFALFSLRTHNSNHLIPLELLVPDPLEKLVTDQLLHHPLVQRLDVRDRVQRPARPQHERILGRQPGGHDARFVLARLEMRVREAEEDGAQLGLAEKVGQKLHRVGADAGYVLVVAWYAVGIC